MNILDILFSLINLGVLGAVGVYIFNRYFKLSLRNQMQQDELLIESLHEERQEAIAIQQQIMQTIQAQDIQCQELKLKVKQWSHVVARKQEQQAQDALHAHERAQEKKKQQEYYYQLYGAKRQVTPVVSELLTEHLKNYFSQQAHARSYIDQVISATQKR